jgi:Circadian oscillating protein COP23
MKTKSFFQLLTASMVALSGIAAVNLPSSAQSKTYFCGNDNGVWTTFARNYNNEKIPVISWEKKLGNYTPKARCQAVSSRFQSAYEQGILNFLTSGISGGQAVICAASQYGGPCTQLLFTLKSHEDASSVLQHLGDIGYKARGPISQSEDASSQVYIDMGALVKGNSAQ